MDEEGGEEREEVEEAHHIEHYLESGVVGRAGDRVVDGRPVDVVAVLAPAGDTTNSAYQRHKGCAFREKGVAQAHGAGICKALEYAAAREHILAPLYAVPLPRYYCRKISIQGAALHKVGPQTCAAPCCCIKWRLAYCGAMGLCHP